MSRRPFCIGVAGAVLAAICATSAGAQDILLEKGRAAPPPRLKGKSATDHYTPYKPPSADELPEGAKVHTIVKGDTLWDLATSYLGDPYFWPQIWEVNRYITDPHWIYPGDPLVIPQPLLITEPLAGDGATGPPPRPVAKQYDVYCAPYIFMDDKTSKQRTKRLAREAKRRERQQARSGSLEPTFKQVQEELRRADESEMLADGDYVGGDEVKVKSDSQMALGALPSRERLLAGPPAIMAAEARGRRSLSDGDVVYINRGESHEVHAGDKFAISRPEQVVYHPENRQRLGIAMQMIGVLEVLCTQENSATAMVISACEDVAIGTLIRPFEPIPIPLAGEFVPTPQYCVIPADRPTGHLIYNKHRRVSVSEEDLVTINLGEEEGLVPGDFLTVYRPNELGPDYPARTLGDAVVLLVEETTATAKILYSYFDMTVGDSVRLR